MGMFPRANFDERGALLPQLVFCRLKVIKLLKNHYPTDQERFKPERRRFGHGLTTDLTWDGIWKSAGQKTGFGWSVEVTLDLSCLKYKPGKNKTRGLSLGRVIPRNLEQRTWTGPLESPSKVSQFGILTRIQAL
jgi:hypothetical protein